MPDRSKRLWQQSLCKWRAVCRASGWQRHVVQLPAGIHWHPLWGESSLLFGLIMMVPSDFFFTTSFWGLFSSNQQCFSTLLLEAHQHYTFDHYTTCWVPPETGWLQVCMNLRFWPPLLQYCDIFAIETEYWLRQNREGAWFKHLLTISSWQQTDIADMFCIKLMSSEMESHNRSKISDYKHNFLPLRINCLPQNYYYTTKKSLIMFHKKNKVNYSFNP